MASGAPKVVQKGPKREPRSLQNRPQRVLANLTKHMVVIDRIALGASPDTVGNSTFFQNASRHPLLGDFSEFVRHFGAPGLQKGCQNGLQFRGEMEPDFQVFENGCPKRPKWAPRGAQTPKMTPKWCPRVPKWGPRGLPNRGF